MATRGKLLLQIGAVGIVAALLALLGWRVASSGESRGLIEKIRNGDKPTAPEFELDRLDGDGTLTLASLRGKTVVLNFWASWCDPCREEAPALQRAYEQWRDQGVVVLGIDFNDFAGDARRFVERYDLTYPVVVDRPGKTVGRFGVTGVPETFFVDRAGRIVSHVQSPIAEPELGDRIEEALASS